MLYGNWRCTQDRLKRGNIEPHDRHAQSEENRGKEIPVLRLLVEQRRMLHDAQPPGPRGHEVEPLHNHQIDKVDGRGLIDLASVVVLIHAVGDRTKGEPELAERDAVALQVPEGHSERGEGLENAHEAVRLENELPVNKAVALDIAWRPEEDVGLGLLVGEHRCGSAVREAAVEC